LTLLRQRRRQPSHTFAPMLRPTISTTDPAAENAATTYNNNGVLS
jgi:hypothetical protein